MNQSNGFSLIELMVTILALAILASIAVPSFQSMIERRRLIAAAEAIYSDLQFARSEAVKRSRVLTVSKADGPCLSISDATASSAVIISNTCLSAFPAITMSTTGLPMSFDRVRGTLGLGGTITLKSSSNQEIRVIGSKFGRVRICSPTRVGGYPAC
jgi:prepilin-type N-terminal cleavage/methylation domain-containing protein